MLLSKTVAHKRAVHMSYTHELNLQGRHKPFTELLKEHLTHDLHSITRSAFGLGLCLCLWVGSSLGPGRKDLDQVVV